LSIGSILFNANEIFFQYWSNPGLLFVLHSASSGVVLLVAMSMNRSDGPRNEIPGRQAGPDAVNPSSTNKDDGTPSFLPQAPSISLPKGGGALRGIGEKTEVNLGTGTAGASIPIQISSARASMQPVISLSYSSGVGNGIFRVGQQISSTSITRKTDKGLPRYEAELDVFILSAAEDLVPRFQLNDQGILVLDAQGRPRVAIKTINGYSVRNYSPRIKGS
jgi:hypothetical protein